MPVSLAIVGAGQRGLQLADWIGRSSRLRTVAVCDVDAERAEAAGRRLGVPAERDHRRLLERPEIEAVLVATGAPWHAPVALDALAAGRHVYVEKPIADTPATARRMAQAAAAAGTVAVVGYQQRFTPFAAVLAQELPPLAPIQALLTAQRGPMNPQYFFPEPYAGIADYVTHTVDLALWSMGGRAEGVSSHVRRGTILGDRTMEFQSLLIDFDEGTRSAAIVTSMLGVRAANLVEFVGAKGTLWTLDQRTVHVATHTGVHQAGNRPPEGLSSREVTCEAAGDSTGASLEAFAARIAGEAAADSPPGPCTFAQAADALAVAAAAVLAWEQGRRVTLGEVLR
jgi:predicted dehydrogenase